MGADWYSDRKLHSTVNSKRTPSLDCAEESLGSKYKSYREQLPSPWVILPRLIVLPRFRPFPYEAHSGLHLFIVIILYWQQKWMAFATNSLSRERAASADDANTLIQ
jgi:hypothetical protein